jgi:hypothetical protein
LVDEPLGADGSNPTTRRHLWVLAKVRDLGLTLIAVQRLRYPDPEQA